MSTSLKKQSFFIGSSPVELCRNAHEVIEIRGDDWISVYKGIGYAHAIDRLSQLLFTRLLAEGRISELILDTEKTFSLDFTIRKLGFKQDIQDEIKKLEPWALSLLEAYCEGINAYIEKRGIPLFFRFLKMKEGLWSVEDVLLVAKLQMYLGLAQLQEHAERFIIQSIQEGVSIEKLKQIFSPHLDGLTEKIISLIRNIPLEPTYLNENFLPGASNNWAVSAKKSASSFPLLCSDPHLQINRLPPLWYEVVLHAGEQSCIGITSPGFPGVIIGRANELSLGITYGMMDTIDFFIEKVERGVCEREEAFCPLNRREEVIRRKKKGEKRAFFFETQWGVIERKNWENEDLEEGNYFSLNWSAKTGGIASSVNAITRLWTEKTVKQAQKIVGEMTFPFNWVLADSEGNIGYQQSGRLPNRKHAGLYPLPAWEKENLWNGFVPSDQLASEYNPERGFVLSANDDKNQNGKPISITLAFKTYRYQRIYRELNQEKKFSLEEMQRLQTDLYSIQAELFIDQIRDFIPENLPGFHLRNWDLCYTKESKGAAVFDAFYRTLLLEVFGKEFGKQAWKEMMNFQSLLIYTHGLFDRILLEGEEALWFGNEGREGCFKRVLETSLRGFSNHIPTWGEVNRFYLNHIFLPKLFSKGPYPLQGNMATVSVSHLFSHYGRSIALGASYRFATDMGMRSIHSALCGGVSEKRFSKGYVSDLSNWLAMKYKKLSI